MSTLAAGTRPASSVERVALAATGGIAIGAGVGVAVAAVWGGVGLLVDRVVRVPVGLDAPATAIVGSKAPGSTLDSALLAIPNATGGERALLASGFLVDAIAAVAIAAGIAWLCARLWSGRGFGRALTRVLGVVGLILIVAPLVAGFLRDIGTNEAVIRLGLDDAVQLGFGFDLSGAVAGIALGLLASVAQLGERLQRETEGLV